MGIVADTAAVVLPGIPGGAGVAINAARITGAAANIAGGALSIQDGLENSDYLEAVIGAHGEYAAIMNIAKKHGDTMIGLKPAAVYKNLVKS